jgi:hypothetical protein
VPFISYEQINVNDIVKTVASFTVPGNTHHAEIMATADVRYTMDNSTDPTQNSGMIFRSTDPPKSFEVEDVKRIRVIRGGASNTTLEVHYFSGREIS